MVDLNQLLPSLGINLTGWLLNEVHGLSLDGTAITGWGRLNNERRSWLVTGVPCMGTCAPTCDTIDFNRDSLFPDTTDIADFVTVFAGGPCSTIQCGDVDFNNDGVTSDVDDIAALLRVFSGGPCQ